jgi:ubiquinone/menaquinone biosynthesis C-methylase UbiE
MSDSGLSTKLLEVSKFVTTAFRSPSLQDCYDATASFYENVFGENQELYSDVIVEFLERRHPQRYRNALDLGAGTGILTRKLLRISDRICGVDFSFGMLEQATAAQYDSGDINYLAGNILSLPLADKRFDLIVALGVMTHILPEHFEDFVREIDRVADESAEVVIAMTPLPWRLFFARRESFEVTAADRILTASYNFVQETLGLDERRGVYCPELFRAEFGKRGYCVEHHTIKNLALVVARRA